MSLTLRFVPYSDIAELGSAMRVKKLIDIVKEDKVVLLEGRLKKEEETDLIAIAMEEINNRFKGIELAVISTDKKNPNIFTNFKNGITSILLGNRKGFTVIGPATIIKEIKKDPNKIELMTKENNKSKSKKKR